MRSYKVARSYTSTLILITFFGLASAQTLSKTEQKIVATADAKNAESIDFLEKLVDVNCGTLNLSGVHQIADMLAPRFRELGFTVIAKYDDSLAGMGAIGGNGHREGEFIDLSHQPMQVKRAALLTYRLSQMDRSKPLQSASN
jgi:hypothetical protein